jgi:FkbM family methyltransferase
VITIFSIPKAFKGHSGLIQSNAVQSWKALGEEVEIFLCADDEGVEDAARRYGVRFAGGVERNEFGTPILRSAFDRVLGATDNGILCYVNADIILLRDFVAGVRAVKMPRFFMVGQRWDLDVQFAIDFARPDWERELVDYADKHGQWHPPYGSDYFVFSRDNQLCDLPPFAVGRPGWDCWFIYRARSLRMPVIDATGTVRPIHQNHDYRHVPKVSGSTTDGKDWSGPETDRHRSLIGSVEHYFTPGDATHRLTRDGVRLALDYERLRQRWRRWPTLNPRVGPIARAVDRCIPRAVKRRLRRLLSGPGSDSEPASASEAPAGVRSRIRRLCRSLGYDLVPLDSPTPAELRRQKLVKSFGIDIVLDVGASTGHFGRRMRRDLGYTGKIISFEPLSAAFRSLAEKAKGDPTWEVWHCGLGDSESRMEINVAGNSDSSSFLEMLPAHLRSAPGSRYIGSETIEVKALDSLLPSLCPAGSNIYLKIDTQGFEDKVLRGAEQSLHRIDTIQVEMSLVPLYEGQWLFDAMHAFLVSKGYSLVSIEPGFADQSTGRLLQFDGIYHRFSSNAAG